MKAKFLALVLILSVFASISVSGQSAGGDTNIYIDSTELDVATDDYYEVGTIVNNTDGEAKEGWAELSIDGDVVDYRWVEVGGSESEQVVFWYDTYGLQEGIHNLSVNFENSSDSVMLNITNETTSRIQGTVSNDSSFAYVIAQNDEGDYFSSSTDLNGNYSMNVRPGQYTVIAYGFSDIDYLVSEESRQVEAVDNQSVVQDLTLSNPQIVDTNLTSDELDVSSSNLNISTYMWGEFMGVQVVNESTNFADRGERYNITSVEGVNSETNFTITIETRDFEPNSLWWGIDDVEMNVTDIGNNTHRTEISGTPSDLQYVFQFNNSSQSYAPFGPMWDRSPSDVTWPQNTTADFGAEGAITISLIDHNRSLFTPDFAESLDGLVVTTNAQTFSRPVMENDALQIYVAGPSYDIDGEQHEGFYRARIPQSQLDDWNVTNASQDLNVTYKGTYEDFTVENAEDGVWIEMNITYSDGYIEVGPDGSTQSVYEEGDAVRATGGDGESNNSDGVNSVILVGVALIILGVGLVLLGDDKEYI